MIADRDRLASLLTKFCILKVFFSALSAYLCDLCVIVCRDKYVTQRSQRYAESADYFCDFPKYGGLTSDGATAAPKAAKSTPGFFPSLSFPLTLLCGPIRQSPFAKSTKPTWSSEFTTKLPFGM